MSEGQLVRIPIPELNEERRQELSRVAGKYAEQAKIAVRNVRRDGMDKLKRMEKEGELSQDEHRLWGEEIQTITDEHIKKIDEMLAAKQHEIMQV
jgi:ribosome recycling factor